MTPERAATIQRNLYHRARQNIVEMLGNKCMDCGSTEQLELHHCDGNGRKCRLENGGYGYGHLAYHLKTGVEQAAADLKLICRDCHFAEHNEDWADGRQTGPKHKSSHSMIRPLITGSS